jgi:hypothetical protein
MANKIAENLAAARFLPMRWWTSFELGQYTLDRLIEISSDSSGAVFIFGGDDQVWYRGSKTAQPRDNVLLEYGIFVSKVGRECTVFVPESGTKIPSDLLSITYEQSSHDHETTASRIVTHFKKVFSKKQNLHPEKISIVIDPDWVNKYGNPIDSKNWRMYHLYCGRGGSQSWLAASGQARYWPTEQKTRIRQMCMESIRISNANTMVSLGSGANELDKEISIQLKKSNSFAKYIPVDLSESLLQRSVINTHESIHVPVGIQADFEDRILFVSREANKYGQAPIVYSCIGNTFGNLGSGLIDHNQ